MAIRKRGKSGLYYAYFRGLDERPDGSLAMVTREVCLHTSDAKIAAALDLQLRDREAKHRAQLRAKGFVRQLMDPDASTPVSAPVITQIACARRLRLSDALDVALKYMSVSPTTRTVWTRFSSMCGVEYMDQVTPEIVHGYLSKYSRGHTANNVRGVIGRIFSVTRMESGMQSSPVDLVPRRKKDSDHQRPISEHEFLRLYAAAPEPWRTAVLIAWHTGLRQIDVFCLRWEQYVAGVITTRPGKTARFGRSVRIPVHPQLAAALDALPRSGPYVLGRWCPEGRVRQYQREVWRELLESTGITSDETGLVTFGSLRDSFVSRLDEAGIPRHAIRGLVGHVSDDMTDLYSHDLETARRITLLPAPPISLPDTQKAVSDKKSQKKP